jgi:hypothetical protein
MSRAPSRSFTLLSTTALLTALALCAARPASAQDDDEDPPGRVARLTGLRGAVSFQPAGEAEWVEASANRPLTTADRLWTEPGARAELGVGPVTARLGSSTDFTVLNLDDRIVQLQLSQGTLLVRVLRLGRDEQVEVDTPNLAFSIYAPGTYRVEASADGGSTVITVRSGEGEASGGGETYPLRSGQAVRFRGTEELDAAPVRWSGYDDLDRWAQRRDRRADSSPSARYVSRDVVGYEDLDDNGTWRDDEEFGAVWIPTGVGPNWAPYHDGYWAFISPWGYTWVDDAPWGYAPFHYGRWVSLEGRWAWVPGPRSEAPVYAPALVAFIGGPGYSVSVSGNGRGPGDGGGEVGWFPLGPREAFVPGYHVSQRYVDRVNVSAGPGREGRDGRPGIHEGRGQRQPGEHVQYVNRSARGGVTVVPQRSFAGAQPVARSAIGVDVQRVGAAPVAPRSAVAPTRSSVFGALGHRPEGVARPPVVSGGGRVVVAKAQPPPPAVPFARRQQTLEAHPGMPLARHEVEAVRPPPAAAPHPMFRMAPPPRSGPARVLQPAEPQTPRAEPRPAEGAPHRPGGEPSGPAMPVEHNQPDAPRTPDRAAPPPARAPDRSPVARPPDRAQPAPRGPDRAPPERARQPDRPTAAPRPPDRAAPPTAEPNPEREPAPSPGHRPQRPGDKD